MKLKSLREAQHSGVGDFLRGSLQLAADNALHAPAKDCAALRAVLTERAREICDIRADLAPLANLLERWQTEVNRISETELEDFRWRAAEAAMALLDASKTAVRDVAMNVARVISKGSTVLTHGPSSTIREAFSALAERGVQAIVTESRPACGGWTLAGKLARWGVSTTLITEAQIGVFVRRADCVLVGAERIMADGTIVNRVGTYLVALAAHDQGVPFYVCCETFKRHTGRVEACEFPESDPSEIGSPPAEGVTVRNVSLDSTPAWLVTGWINEKGLVPLLEG